MIKKRYTKNKTPVSLDAKKMTQDKVFSIQNFKDKIEIKDSEVFYDTYKKEVHVKKEGKWSIYPYEEYFAKKSIKVKYNGKWIEMPYNKYLSLKSMILETKEKKLEKAKEELKMKIKESKGDKNKNEIYSCAYKHFEDYKNINVNLGILANKIYDLDIKIKEENGKNKNDILEKKIKELCLDLINKTLTKINSTNELKTN